MQRRSFLSGIIAAAAAPAIVKAGSLMPIWVPKWHRGGFAWSGVVYLNDSVFGKTSGLYRNEVFDEFVVMQLRHMAASMHIPYEELVMEMPNTTLGYTSARIAAQQGFLTSLSRPLSARFSNGHSPS